MWQRQNNNSTPLSTEALLNKASAYCSRSEHCPQEVADKLRVWGADRQQTEEVIHRLTDNGFISKERYCRAFVHDKVLFQAWGREKIRAALAAKRLPSALVQAALDDIPDEDYAAALQRVIGRKKEELKSEEPAVAADKLKRHLLSRGFTFGDIEAAGL